MNNLIKNNIRANAKNKLQITLLFLLSAILGFLFTYLYYGNVPMRDSYKSDLENTNIEEFRIFPKTDISTIEEKYDFNSELFQRKYVQEDKKTFYINEPTSKINKYYIIDGSDTVEEDQILLSLQYANGNNIKVNDKISIEDKEYIVSGLYYMPSESLIFNSQYSSAMLTSENAGVLMNKENFDKIDGNSENVYIARFNEKLDDGQFDSKIKGMMEDNNISFIESSKKLQSYNTLLSNFDTSLSLMMIGLVLFVSVIVIVIMLLVRNQFQYSRRCSGVLMSIGYKRVSIVIPFIILQIPIFIGMTLGALLGIFMSDGFLTNYFKVFNIVHPEIEFDYAFIIGIIIAVNIIMAFIIFIFGLKLLNKNELDLIHDRGTENVNKVTKISKRLFEKFPFESKIRYAFLFKKLWRFLIIVFVSMISFFLINFAVAIFKLTLDPINQMENQMKYKAMIIYNDIKNEEDEESRKNQFLSYRFYIESAEKSSEKRNIEKKYDVQFINSNNNQVNIGGSSEENLISKLGKGKIIISSRLAYDYNLAVGDSLNIKNSNGDIHNLSIGAINTTIYDSMLYINADYIGDIESNIKVGDYNGKYSEDVEEKVDGIKLVTSSNEQVEQIITVLKGSLSLVPMMIVITIILIVSLTSLISYFNINDSKKDITILGILGYQNKVISKMLVNIYTSALFIGSIICALFIDKVFEFIQTIVNQSTDVFILFETNTLWKIISFLLVYVIYKLSILVMKRRLNKIEVKDVLYAD